MWTVLWTGHSYRPQSQQDWAVCVGHLPLKTSRERLNNQPINTLKHGSRETIKTHRNPTSANQGPSGPLVSQIRHQRANQGASEHQAANQMITIHANKWSKNTETSQLHNQQQLAAVCCIQTYSNLADDIKLLCFFFFAFFPKFQFLDYLNHGWIHYKT